MTHPCSSKYFLPEGYSPTEVDIVCGRGKAYAKLPGNIRFSQAIRSSLHRYAAAHKRIDKSTVVASVVDTLRAEGMRFIKMDKKAQVFCQLNNDQVHEKTGHAIRDLLKNIANNRSPSSDGMTDQGKQFLLRASTRRESSSLRLLSLRDPPDLPMSSPSITPNNTVSGSSALDGDTTLRSLQTAFDFNPTPIAEGRASPALSDNSDEVRFIRRVSVEQNEVGDDRMSVSSSSDYSGEVSLPNCPLLAPLPFDWEIEMDDTDVMLAFQSLASEL